MTGRAGIAPDYRHFSPAYQRICASLPAFGAESLIRSFPETNSGKARRLFTGPDCRAEARAKPVLASALREGIGADLPRVALPSIAFRARQVFGQVYYGLRKTLLATFGPYGCYGMKGVSV